MPQESYSVRLRKTELVFSAAHFITFAGNICERLHGHNYRTAVEVFGPLMGEPLGARIGTDIGRWKGGDSACSAVA